jgi:arylsulfatase A-like enzyme
VAQQPQEPNILVIMADDIGYWNISAYNRGMMGYRTPNIDRIAKEGALFTDYPDGMVEHDAQVGQLLKTLDDLGIANNTIVIYTTDNGAETFTWPDGGTTPSRARKTPAGRADIASRRWYAGPRWCWREPRSTIFSLRKIGR